MSIPWSFVGFFQKKKTEQELPVIIYKLNTHQDKFLYTHRT